MKKWIDDSFVDSKIREVYSEQNGSCSRVSSCFFERRNVSNGIATCASRRMKHAFFLIAVVWIVTAGCSSSDSPGSAENAAMPTLEAQAPAHCPQCGGALVKAGTIQDDPEQPSKNLAVWNRSSCGNPFYDDDSVICGKCWLAHAKAFDRWERSSVLPQSFRQPLAAAIRDCPLPSAEDTKSLVVYSQQIEAPGVQESVGFWCTDSAEYLAQLKAYTRENKLSFRVDQRGRIANQVYVAVETKPAAEPPNAADQPGG